MEYQDYEERAEGEFVLFLCRRNLGKPDADPSWSALLFPTMDRATDEFGDRCKNIFTGPAGLARQFGGQELFDMYQFFNSQSAKASSLKGKQLGLTWSYGQLWSDLAKQYADELAAPHLQDMPDEMRFNRNDAAHWLWQLIQSTQDRRMRVSSHNEMDDEEMFTIRLDRMNTPEGQATYAAFNKQKRQICEELVRLGQSRALEHELRAVMVQAVMSQRIKTKQDPWRIFSYYAPELGDAGFLYYPSKRHKLEDHTLNV